MKTRFLWIFALSAAVLAGCSDSDQPQQTSTQESVTAGGTSSGGSGQGDVAIGRGDDDKMTIADRYNAALGMIKKHDWDGARSQLVEALNRSADKEVQKDIRQHLQLVDQALLGQPAFTVAQAFAGASKLYDQHISLRGRLLSGGDVGRATYYFWLENGRKIKCRYGDLSINDKKLILSLQDGTVVLVRGTLKSPWGNNPDPYMEVSFFHIERLPQPQPPAATQEDQP